MLKLKALSREILSILVILSSLLFAGSITYAFAPRSTTTTQPAQEEATTVVTKQQEINYSPFIAQPTQPQQVLGTKTKTVSPSLTPIPSSNTSTPTNNPTTPPVPIIVVHNITQVVSPTPSQTPEPTPTIVPSPSPASQTVSIEINSPSEKSNFTIDITDNMNACQILQKAKEEGKITSLTLDDKYLESFGTLLVAEMNGYSNNWVFTVNGESPMGCSLSFPKSGDQIVWNYLAS